MIARFVVPGKPVGKKRPRFFVNKKTGRLGKYHEQETDEGKFKLFIANQWAGKPLITGPVQLLCRFYFGRPRSHFGTGRNSDKRKSSAPEFHMRTPDLDNCVKFVEDCFNGVVWRDDSQVWQIKAAKHYIDCGPYTEIEITWAG